MCVPLRLLSHLTLMFAQSGVFNLDYPTPLSLFSRDTPVALFSPSFSRPFAADSVAAIHQASALGLVGWKLPSLGITGGDNAILLLANCDARKTALLSYEYSATVAGDVNLPHRGNYPRASVTMSGTLFYFDRALLARTTHISSKVT